MDKKINELNEMIDHRKDEEGEPKESNNHCTSNRSSPTSDREQQKQQQRDDEDDTAARDEDVSMTESSRDNGDRCSVKSSNANNNSLSTRTMAEELARRDKEVSIRQVFYLI